jgi:hypothetical protein
MGGNGAIANRKGRLCRVDPDGPFVLATSWPLGRHLDDATRASSPS